MAKTSELPDELNRIFLFNLTQSELLVQIVSGEIDAVELARRQLRDRGLKIREYGLAGNTGSTRKTNTEVLKCR